MQYIIWDLLGVIALSALGYMIGITILYILDINLGGE
jgi:hypothetical protein